MTWDLLWSIAQTVRKICKICTSAFFERTSVALLALLKISMGLLPRVLSNGSRQTRPTTESSAHGFLHANSKTCRGFLRRGPTRERRASGDYGICQPLEKKKTSWGPERNYSRPGWTTGSVQGSRHTNELGRTNLPSMHILTRGKSSTELSGSPKKVRWHCIGL